MWAAQCCRARNSCAIGVYWKSIVVFFPALSYFVQSAARGPLFKRSFWSRRQKKLLAFSTNASLENAAAGAAGSSYNYGLNAAYHEAGRALLHGGGVISFADVDRRRPYVLEVSVGALVSQAASEMLRHTTSVGASCGSAHRSGAKNSFRWLTSVSGIFLSSGVTSASMRERKHDTVTLPDPLSRHRFAGPARA